MKKSFSDILSAIDDGTRRRFSSKLPTWAAAGCSVPTSLSLEQCSSEATAAYKASLVSGTLADMTGGLGADSYAFSRRCVRVLYHERDRVLVATAQSNFALLGASNISCIIAETGPDTVFPDCDWTYLDPARRSATGRKVFLPEDCSPDFLKLLPGIFEHCPKVMVKLSPMADITMLSGRIGRHLKEVHVVGTEGETRELLCIIERDWDGPFDIVAVELPGDPVRFSMEDIRHEAGHFCTPMPGMTLWEPSSVMMKSGAYRLAGLPALGPSTHLFIGGNGLPGKEFHILEVHPLNKAAIKDIGARYPRAEVSARGIPLTSDELRLRLKAVSGERIHIFGAGTPEGRLLIVTSY